MEAKLVKGAKLEVGGSVHRWDIHVAPIQDDFILGLDFLRDKGCVLDLEKDVVHILGVAVHASMKRNVDGDPYHISQIIASRKLVVPPHTVKMVMARMEPPTRNIYAFQPAGDVMGMMVPNLVFKGGTEVPVLFGTTATVLSLCRKGMPWVRLSR